MLNITSDLNLVIEFVRANKRLNVPCSIYETDSCDIKYII